MSLAKIENIFSTLRSEFDDKIDTELKYQNHYQLLVAIMLSAQSTDKSVNNITKELFKVLRQPQDAISLGEAKINQYIRTINYHNTKAKHIVKMSQQLIDNFNAKVPKEFDDLLSLAGVGRKTANLIMSIAFKQSYIAVDTHVLRVSNRLGLVSATNAFTAELQLKKNVPFKYHRQINNLLIPFGRKYCKARKPNCAGCPLRHCCRLYNTLHGDKKQPSHNQSKKRKS